MGRTTESPVLFVVDNCTVTTRCGTVLGNIEVEEGDTPLFSGVAAEAPLNITELEAILEKMKSLVAE